jgi:hypothetical protein
MKHPGKMVVLISACLIWWAPVPATAPCQGAPPAPPEAKVSLKVRVVDAATSKPIPDTAVEIYSDNGIRCIKAPCPTNGVKWTGKTDHRGVVIVPARVRQATVTISATGYDAKDLISAAQKRGRIWVIALVARR